MKNKIIPILLTILTIVYLFLCPIIYKWYIDNGYNEPASTFSLILIGFIVLMSTVFSWITSD